MIVISLSLLAFVVVFCYILLLAIIVLDILFGLFYFPLLHSYTALSDAAENFCGQFSSSLQLSRIEVLDELYCLSRLTLYLLPYKLGLAPCLTCYEKERMA